MDGPKVLPGNVYKCKISVSASQKTFRNTCWQVTNGKLGAP